MFKPSVLGLAVLALRIRQLGPIRKARLQRGFEKRGAALVESIKAVTPVRKGALRASVRMVPNKKYPGVVILAGGTPATARHGRGGGGNLDEALMTEYGTRHEKAEPFFWPTVNAAEGGITAGVKADVADPSGD